MPQGKKEQELKGLTTSPSRGALIKKRALSGLGVHPEGEPETFIERRIKAEALKRGTFMEREDMPYLEQYLHPEHDVLHRQTDRPSLGGNSNDKLEYRKPHLLEETEVQNPDKYNEVFTAYQDKAKKGLVKPGDWDKATKDWPMHNYPVYNVEGLGNFKYDASNPEYDSIYDKWDFDTQTPLSFRKMIEMGDPNYKKPILPSLSHIEDWAAKEFMKRVGSPYHVYERVNKGTKDDNWRAK